MCAHDYKYYSVTIITWFVVKMCPTKERFFKFQMISVLLIIAMALFPAYSCVVLKLFEKPKYEVIYSLISYFRLESACYVQSLLFLPIYIPIYLFQLNLTLNPSQNSMNMSLEIFRLASILVKYKIVLFVYIIFVVICLPSKWIFSSPRLWFSSMEFSTSHISMY